MTRGDHVLEFRVLGPLEASVDGEALQLGSAKQRTVLATLLVSAGEIVPAERIVDELWGESPPASAEHTVTVYISRIRRLLNGYGPILARRGEGYVLELAEGALDSRAFGDSAAAVARATAAGDHELAVRQGREGLSLWRGSVLADVSLGPQARAAAERLEELRLHVSELVVEAELALGRHEHVVGELQTLVDRNPYRERFIAQLMLALYRSGRQVEALEVYERTRRRLDDDLALQPSADLQHLSAQIVRQERTLRAPSELSTGGRSRAAGHDARRASLVAGVAAAVVAAMTLAAAGSTPQSAVASDADATRVALVLQRGSTVSAFPSSRSHDLADALFVASAQSGYEAQLIELPDEVTREGVARAATVLADEEVDLVLFGLNATTAAAFAPVARGLGDGRAVFIDASMRKLGLEGVANVSAITFATEQTAQLAGALSGLVAPRGAPAGRHVDAVSVVAGLPTPETRRVVAAFREGLSRARPGGRVLVSYAGETVDPTACERVANRQIDAGSDVVFVHAGMCGTGALAVSRARGVWAIASDGLGRARDNVIGASFTDWDNAVYAAIQAFRDGRLPPGRDATLGLDGYHVGLEMHTAVPARVASKVVELCSDLRVRSESDLADASGT